MNGASPLAAALARFSALPSEPSPLVPPARTCEPYPIDALGGVLADAVHAITTIVQCPAALAAQCTLAAASLAVQGNFDVLHPIGRRVPCSLLLVTLGESGERKSTADKLACEAIERAAQDGADPYLQAYGGWRNACEAKEAARNRAKRAKSGNVDDIRAALDAIGENPFPPLNPRRTVSDPNFEGLLKHMIGAHGSLGWFNNEAGQSIGGTALHEDNKLKFGAGLSMFWDGQAVDRIRAGDGATVLRGRRLTVHLMVQPEIARPFLADPVLRAQGWLSRALVCEPPSMIGRRPFRLPTQSDLGALTPFHRRIRELIDAPAPCGAKPNEVAPPVLEMNANAMSVWCAFHDGVEAELGEAGSMQEHRGFGAKLAENVLRVACILAGFEGAAEISAAHVARAVLLGDFYASEAVRQRDAASVDADLALAERTRVWLTDPARWEKSTVTLREIQRFGPNPVRKKERSAAIAATLAEHGWLVPGDGLYAIRGRGQ